MGEGEGEGDCEDLVAHLGDRVELLLATAVESSRWRGGHAQSRLPKPHIAATAAA